MHEGHRHPCIVVDSAMMLLYEVRIILEFIIEAAMAGQTGPVPTALNCSAYYSIDEPSFLMNL